MGYRDDLSAARAKIAQMESEMLALRAENDRLRRELEAPPSAPPAEEPPSPPVGQRFGWADPMKYAPIVIIAVERTREHWALADSFGIKVLLVATTPIMLVMSVVMNVLFLPLLILWGHHVRWR